MPLTNQMHIDAALSNISVQYKNTNFIASEVFPKLQVKKSSDKYFIFDKDFRIPETLRGNRAESRVYDFKMSNATYSLEKHALKGFISEDDIANFDAGDLRVSMVESLMNKIMLKMEERCAALFTSTSWSLNVSLAATTQFSLDTTASNPIPVFDTAATTVLNNSGYKPNFGIVPHEVFVKIKNHSSVIDRLKYTSEVVDQVKVAKLLGLDSMLVPTTQYDSALEGATSTVAALWSDNCFVGYKPATPSILAPSCGYLFSSKDPQVKRWTDDKIESEVIEVGAKYQFKVVASLAGYLIKDCIA